MINYCPQCGFHNSPAHVMRCATNETFACRDCGKIFFVFCYSDYSDDLNKVNDGEEPKVRKALETFKIYLEHHSKNM